MWLVLYWMMFIVWCFSRFLKLWLVNLCLLLEIGMIFIFFSLMQFSMLLVIIGFFSQCGLNLVSFGSICWVYFRVQFMQYLSMILMFGLVSLCSVWICLMFLCMFVGLFLGLQLKCIFSVVKFWFRQFWVFLRKVLRLLLVQSFEVQVQIFFLVWLLSSLNIGLFIVLFMMFQIVRFIVEMVVMLMFLWFQVWVW